VSGAAGKAKSKGNLRPSLIDPDLASAVSHPLRVHILDVLCENTASPSDMARDAGLSVNHIAYHVKELEKLGYIELVRTEPRRGTVEHYYRAKRRFFFDDDAWERLPLPVRRGIGADILKLFAQDAKAAFEEGTIDARPNHLSNTTLLVDEEGWREFRSILDETLERVLALQAECAKRLEPGDEGSVPVSVTLAGFEIPRKFCEPGPGASSDEEGPAAKD
jgi:DNA-binding transcriptional ArsR family regulator